MALRIIEFEQIFMNLRSHLFLLLATLIQQSCYYDNREDLYAQFEPECITETVSFSADIAPIINTNCAFSGCHAGPSPSAGLDLSSHPSISNAVLNGRVLNRINLNNGDGGQMPPTGKLSDCTILLIEEWALNGAPNN